MGNSEKDWEKKWALRAIKERDALNFAELARQQGEEKKRERQARAKKKEESFAKFCLEAESVINGRFENLSKKGWFSASAPVARAGRIELPLEADERGNKRSEERMTLELNFRAREETGSIMRKSISLLMEKEMALNNWFLKWGFREQALGRIVNRAMKESARLEGVFAKEMGLDLAQPVRSLKEANELNGACAPGKKESLFSSRRV